jgi:hypothetical protein
MGVLALEPRVMSYCALRGAAVPLYARLARPFADFIFKVPSRF